MTTLVARCDRDTTHPAHFHTAAGTTGSDLASCPGIYTDEWNPDTDIPDLTPERLYLTDAAAMVVRAHVSTAVTARAQYVVAMGLWQALTGLDEPEALTYAYQIATVNPPVTGTVVPF